MAQGKTNFAIAATLFVTERAVEKHTNSIFAKLGLSEEKDVNRLTHKSGLTDFTNWMAKSFGRPLRGETRTPRPW
jgi:hypothetical protein